MLYACIPFYVIIWTKRPWSILRTSAPTGELLRMNIHQHPIRRAAVTIPAVQPQAPPQPAALLYLALDGNGMWKMGQNRATLHKRSSGDSILLTALWKGSWSRTWEWMHCPPCSWEGLELCCPEFSTGLFYCNPPRLRWPLYSSVYISTCSRHVSENGTQICGHVLHQHCTEVQSFGLLLHYFASFIYSCNRNCAMCWVFSKENTKS